MYWSGTWSAGTYERYEVVENRGGIWSVSADPSTTTEPGTLAGINDWDRLGNQTTEIWQATPILSMASTVIQWTFAPIFTGQTPVLLTESAGVFTFQTNGSVIDFRMNVLVDYQIAANNAEAWYTFNDTYSGAGISTLLGMANTLLSPRSGTFSQTNMNLGSVIAAASDTISFVGDSGGTSLSDADLTSGYLIINGPAP